MIINTKNEMISILGNEHSEFIYDAFYTHQYIPQLRKYNNAIETLFMSLHQNYFFEKEYNRNNSYIDRGVINEDEYEIIEMIINHKLDNITIFNILNNYHKYNWEILLVILIIKLTKLICVFHVSKLLYINHTNSYKDFLNAYIESHNAFIQTSLTLHNKYNDISNYINNHISKSTSNYFSIYETLFDIWKHEVFSNMENDINTSITNIMPTFINEIITSNNPNYDDYYNFNDEITIKEVIEQIASCLLDFAINANNVKYIKHTAIPLCEEYYKFEHILSTAIITSFQKRSNINIDIISKIEHFINDEINFIPHTKLIILNDVVSFLKEYLIVNITNDFNIFLAKTNTTSSSSTPPIYHFNNNTNTHIGNNYLTSNNQINLKYQELLDIICEHLQQNTQLYDKNYLQEQISIFINCKNNQITFLKHVIIFYLETLLKFENMNDNIINSIFNTFTFPLNNSLCKCSEYKPNHNILYGKGIELDGNIQKEMNYFK